MGAASREVEARKEEAALGEGARSPAGGPGREAPMEEAAPEALRLWLRGAYVRSVVELMAEAVRGLPF